MINTEALQRSYNLVHDKWDPYFEWVVNEFAPWTPFRQPLTQTALALVGTCGAYRRDVDCSFDAANYYGDPSFKEIRVTRLPTDWNLLTHTTITPTSPKTRL